MLAGLTAPGHVLANVAAQTRSLEQPIKATFLYRFADFVTWPDHVFAAPESPINLCVVGRDPFGESLDKAVDGQRAGGRPVAIYRLEILAPDTGCHIAYIAGSNRQSVRAALEAAEGDQILTVTDAAMGGAAEGMIHFQIIDNKVRFNIDEAEAVRHNLDMSSRLLGIALNVKRSSL